MSHIIGKGRRASETYPGAPRPASAGAGSPIVRMGFGNSITDITYSDNDFLTVLRDPDTYLTVPLTGFTPGNIILIGYSVLAADGIGSGPGGIGMFVRATVNLGSGRQPIVPHTIGFQPLPPTAFLFFGLGWKTFYKPPADTVLADPIIGLEIDPHQGVDPVSVTAGAALLWAAEVDEAFVTQDPETTLEP